MSVVEALHPEYPVVYEQKVLWQHVDAARHVNNVTYVQWFEDARVYYFEKLGLAALPGESEDPVGIILAWQACKYTAPLFYLETALIGIRITKIEEDRFWMECKMVSREREQVVALAESKIVAYDYLKHRKTALKPNWVQRIQELEGPEKYLISIPQAV
ncbi:MAG: acyl-CoA thioesterase [Bacteroidetes Order II. Incertae sedis bacterium]|nr:acyl-CoA thioesterase [Bacteroidetes Order II. bacterium]